MSSSLHPHSVTDLALAPVVIHIERNLAQVRDSADLEYAFALALNDDNGWYHSPAERAGRVLQVALREVELHGWQAGPTPDLQGLMISHGEYRVCVMFGRRLAEYVERGPCPQPLPGADLRHEQIQPVTPS